MSNFIIYHNPRCSKSRQTLEIIKKNGIEPQVILYLENPPSPKELMKVLDYLNIEPREILRKSEQEYKTFNLKDKNIDNSEMVRIMTENPKLIERPIVVSRGKAIIGRPPENVLALIN